MSEVSETAADELLEYLNEGEEVYAVVFGNWGWCYSDEPETGGYGEPDPPPVPLEMRGKVLSWEVASKYMSGWSFSGGFGAPNCFATYIWTTSRVIFVSQYDGSTRLESIPRDPIDCIPDMPGG